MVARTGKDYIERLKNNPLETWIGNEKVTDPTNHKLIKEAVQSTARLYDLQWEKQNELLYLDENTGEQNGVQFLIPRSQGDLKKRREFHLEWAKSTYGFMGRSTDFMSGMMLSRYISADFFGEYAQNIRNYFEYIRDNDLFLTHVLINPQVDRSQPPNKQPDEFTYLGVVRETSEGIIVRGAKMLATAGPYADEVLVFPYGFQNQGAGEDASKYAISFAIPMNTSGLRVVAREPYSGGEKADNPLSSQFDELDGVLIFDDVLVPWERVFIYKDIDKALNSSKKTGTSFVMHQASARLLVKMEFLAGMLMRATEMIKTNTFINVQDKIAEITTYIELFRAGIEASESTAIVNENGIYLPNEKPLKALRNSGNRWYPRIREIFQEVIAGGLMYQPASVNIFDSPLKTEIEKYYRGVDVSAQEKIKLFKLTSEIAVSKFGSRHELYERYYNGDPMFLRVTDQYLNYDREECYQLIDKFLNSYDINLVVKEL